MSLPRTVLQEVEETVADEVRAHLDRASEDEALLGPERCIAARAGVQPHAVRAGARGHGRPAGGDR